MKRQVQPSTQEEPEWLGVDPLCSRGWECGECSSRMAVLRLQQCPPSVIQARPHHNRASNCLVAFCCQLCRGWSSRSSGGVRDNSPRRHQTCRCHRVSALTNCLEARRSALTPNANSLPNWQNGPPKPSVWSARTVLNQYLALVEPHIRRRAKARLSSIHGMR